MAFPIVKSRTQGSTGDSFSITVTIPGSASSGDLFVIVAVTRFAGTMTWPAGWTRVCTPIAFQDTCEVRWKALNSTDISGGSITINKDYHGNAGWTAHLVSRAQSVEGAGYVGTGIYDPPNLAPSWGLADTLWIATSADFGSNNDFSSYPSGYSNGMNGGNSEAWIATADKFLRASSEDPPTFGWSFNIRTQAATVAVQPSVPGNPTSWGQIVG